MEIEKLLKLQDELNILTAGENWKSGTTDKGREIDWYRAIMMETCELIDSLNWKHWLGCSSPEASRLRQNYTYKDGNFICNKTGKQIETYINKSHKYLCIDDSALLKTVYGKETKLKCQTVHRLVFMYHNGNIPTDKRYVVDHRDQNIYNNKIENLRLLDCSSNSRNSPVFTKAKGYYFDKKSKVFKAQTRVNGKKIYLGSFKTEKEASNRYQQFVKDNPDVFAPKEYKGLGFKGCDDIDNARVELADIWHFILSQMLVEGFDGKKYINFENKPYNRDKTIYHSTSLIHEVSSPITARLSVILKEFNELMCMLFETEEEFVKLYLGKSILNRFRVANKYAEGKYIKLWVGGNEDNVYMQDFLEITQDPDELYNLLKIEYAKVSDEVN